MHNNCVKCLFLSFMPVAVVSLLYTISSVLMNSLFLVNNEVTSCYCFTIWWLHCV